MRRATAIAIALAGCTGGSAPPPQTPQTPSPVAHEPPPVAAPDATRSWLAPRPVSWPEDRTKAQFHGLGGGTAWSVAIAVSADGSTPVGIARPAGGLDEAVRWSRGTMSPLATLDLDGDDRSTAWGVSRDGSVVVGESTATNTSAVPVRWGPDGKATRLPLPESSDSAVAHAVSRDGKVIVGCAGGGCDAAIRWSGTNAPTAVGPEAPFHLAAHPISDDGKAIAGNRGGGDPARAVRVTAAGAIEVFPEGTRVEAISDDGKTAGCPPPTSLARHRPTTRRRPSPSSGTRSTACGRSPTRSPTPA